MEDVGMVCLICISALSYLLLLYKVDVGGALDLDWLTLSVVQRQHEVEEVGLSQIRRRLLLKMSTGQAHPTERRRDGRSDAEPPLAHEGWLLVLVFSICYCLLLLVTMVTGFSPHFSPLNTAEIFCRNKSNHLGKIRPLFRNIKCNIKCNNWTIKTPHLTNLTYRTCPVWTVGLLIILQIIKKE